MLSVSAQELDSVASLGGSIHLTFFGVASGALIAFGITLATVSITDTKTFAAIVALTAVATVLSLYFGVRGMADFRAAKRRLSDIKKS